MFAALHIPDFRVVAALRSTPAARGNPCGLLAETTSTTAQEKLPLEAVNAEARFAGVEAGWALNRALVRCPGLVVLPGDPVAEEALLGELIHLAELLSPDYEVTGRDLIIVDLASRPRAADGLLEEMALADSAIWYAQAATPDLAGLAAKNELTWGSLVTSGNLRELPLEMLASLPTERSPMPLLELWGLKTLGDFMALPRQSLMERLGPDAGRWHDILHARTCRLLRLHRPPESFAQEFHFDDAVVALDPLIFAVKRLLHTLAGRLGARHLAAKELAIRLDLDSDGTMERRVRLPDPQTAVEGMLAPMQTLLESLKLEAPVTVLHLDAGTTFATAAQREWFGRQLPEPTRWAETLAKLEALLGTGRVGIPVPGNSFRPDSSLMHPGAGEPPRIPEIPPRPACAIPLSRFRPPRRVSVVFDAGKDGSSPPRPLAVLNGPYPGEIAGASGPFALSGDWWNPEESWGRIGWKVEMATGHLLKLGFQRPDVWEVEGIYL